MARSHQREFPFNILALPRIVISIVGIDTMMWTARIIIKGESPWSPRLLSPETKDLPCHRHRMRVYRSSDLTLSAWVPAKLSQGGRNNKNRGLNLSYKWYLLMALEKVVWYDKRTEDVPIIEGEELQEGGTNKILPKNKIGALEHRVLIRQAKPFKQHHDMKLGRYWTR